MLDLTQDQWQYKISFCRLFGVREEKYDEVVEKYGFQHIIMHPESVLHTKTQLQKFTAFRELFTLVPYLRTVEERPKLTDPEKVAKFLRSKIKNFDQEHLVVIFANTKLEPIAVELNSMGTSNATMLNVQSIVKSAILYNATSVIVGHNHPSGDLTPSREDRLMTSRLGEALKILNIDLCDHVIFSDLPEKSYSLRVHHPEALISTNRHSLCLEKSKERD